MFGLRIVKKPRRKKPARKRSFLDFAILLVFAATFLFTYAVFKQVSQPGYWDPGVMVSLVDNWFRIMVGELLVGGLIAISKNIGIEREITPCAAPTVVVQTERPESEGMDN